MKVDEFFTLGRPPESLPSDPPSVTIWALPWQVASSLPGGPPCRFLPPIGIVSLEFVVIEWCTPRYQESLDLRHAVLRQPLGLAFSGEDLDAEHSDLHFGVVEGDQLIAVVVARPATKSMAKLRQMAVSPDWQKSGVGTFLVQAVESHLKDGGYSECQLHARESAVPFYKNVGYEVTGEPFEEVTLPHRKMSKLL